MKLLEPASIRAYSIGAVSALFFLLPGLLAADQAKRITLVIQERQLAAGAEALRVTEGDQLELVWESDEEVALHLHGYDIELTVQPGEAAVMVVDAAVAGRFPITSHGFGGEHDHSERALAYLEVYPE